MTRPDARHLSRPVRRAVLVVHVVVSVGWLGISLCLLTLGIAGAVTATPGAPAAAYGSMRLFTDWLLLPVAAVALLSGLVLSLGTHWGLTRHRWVLVKFWLTLAATLATTFALRPSVHETAARAAEGAPVSAADMIGPPAVSLCLYVFITAISVLKPWGRTRSGRTARGGAPQRAARKPVETTRPVASV